jgi:hypothetical protein
VYLLPHIRLTLTTLQKRVLVGGPSVGRSVKLLLVLASTVILDSMSSGTHDRKSDNSGSSETMTAGVDNCWLLNTAQQ